MKSFASIAFCVFTFCLNKTAFPFCASRNYNYLFQIATIGSLAQGVYDGMYDYGNLMKQGDFGLGTFDQLNGEMVAIDGHFYQIEASGKIKSVIKKQTTPFSEVTFFKPRIFKFLNDASSYRILGLQIKKSFPNKNIPYAIRIDGEFKFLKLRSFYKQQKPYPLLTQASEKQAIFTLHNVKGSLIGFWFPPYWAGIAVPEFHLHFITQDRSAGGHALEISLLQGKLSIAPICQVQVYLPTTKAFAKANLSANDLFQSIKKAEGGVE